MLKLLLQCEKEYLVSPTITHIDAQGYALVARLPPTIFPAAIIQSFVHMLRDEIKRIIFGTESGV